MERGTMTNDPVPHQLIFVCVCAAQLEQSQKSEIEKNRSGM